MKLKLAKLIDHVQELSTDKSQELILLTERIKYLESEDKFLKG